MHTHTHMPHTHARMRARTHAYTHQIGLLWGCVQTISNFAAGFVSMLGPVSIATASYLIAIREWKTRQGLQTVKEVPICLFFSTYHHLLLPYTRTHADTDAEAYTLARTHTCTVKDGPICRTCIRMRTRTCTPTRMRTHTRANTDARSRARVHACTHTRAHAHTYRHTHTHVRAHTRTRIPTCMHTHTRTGLHMSEYA